MNKSFWKNKKVLITGFEGFLGSNLTRALISSGANIFGLDIKVKRRDTILNSDDYRKISLTKGSVTDYQLLRKIIIKNKINVVFHLAAEAIVGKCYGSPLRTFSTNIKGTWNILEVCRVSEDIQSIVIASSDKAYGAHKKLPYTEEAPLQGNHPYDASKSCADIIANTYAHTYNLPVCITRCGNIFGPGDFNFSRLIPDVIISALAERKFRIRSDGKFIRDYVFVDDIVDGYIILAERISKLNLLGEAFNFSNEKPVRVLELVNKIYNLVNKKPNYVILNLSKYEIRYQYLASGKAKRILNWKARHDLKSGLIKTINWYSKNNVDYKSVR
jgi:CDP-glucose 4,6-dehydratase